MIEPLCILILKVKYPAVKKGLGGGFSQLLLAYHGNVRP